MRNVPLAAKPPHTTELPYTLKADRFSSHMRIAALVQKYAEQIHDEPYAVLDIGCAYGFLRKYLPSPRFYLIGVDVNKQAIEQARVSYDEVYLADIATDDLPLQQPPCTIVFGDVLEHLADPLAVLQGTLRKYARQGTQVIVSLPNIAHLYVRLNLLLGRFEYTDRGIMDRTHLRFFTLRSAKRLIEESKLQLASVDVTPIPLPLVHPMFGEGNLLFPLHMVNNALAKTLKSLLAYQFILEAYHAGY